MKCIPILFLLLFASVSSSDEPQAQDHSLFKAVKVVPVNRERFTEYFAVPQETDEIGAEQPPTITYFLKDSKTYDTAMAVTDLSLCVRPDQKKTCESFMNLISGAVPSIGTDITETRIEGSDYTTVFLKRVDSVHLDNVDSFIAFLGGDSQDPPLSNIVLYIYAKKGTNLIQLYTGVDKCTNQPDPNESEVAYYKRLCVNQEILVNAKSKGVTLTGLFRLK